MKREAILADLAQSLSLPELPLDASGICSLHLPDGLQVDLQFIEHAEQLRLSAPLGQADPSDPKRHLSVMLLTNLVNSEYGWPCLALEPGTGRVALTQVLELGASAGPQVKRSLDAFAAGCHSTRTEMTANHLLAA